MKQYGQQNIFQDCSHLGQQNGTADYMAREARKCLLNSLKIIFIHFEATQNPRPLLVFPHYPDTVDVKQKFSY
ncbi:hypothetical protein JTB14_017037 [Gonioctena quinquepunctata]|nr:hypothetical protein JTB14_017037 [Gonioctena quinquepunctata]